MSNPIKIVISSGNQTGRSESIDSNNQFLDPMSKDADSGQTIARSAVAGQLIGAAVNAAKRTISYGLSMYGDYTGDYVKQAQIDNALEIGSTILGIGASIVGGAVVGGPVGAIVSGVVAVANTAVNEILKVNTYNLNLAKQNAVASFNSSRIGRILTDGNR